ncbi:MAG: AMP-binding protein [Akkermansia sp.]|nr:AMP-binding protein [Akkermansia sp.]
MTNPPTIEGSGNIPASPTLVIPNRVDLPALRALEEALGGRSRITWMVENTLRPIPEVMLYLSQPGTSGFLCAIDRSSREDLINMVRERLLQGRYVVLLCGRPGQQPATICDVPGKLLSFADDSKLSALPVYVGMYNNSLVRGITTTAPWDREVVQFMPEVKPGPNLGAAVRSAWMEAEAEQLAAHPALQGTLPEALLAALSENPGAMIIDGVDDSQLTYRRLLSYALVLCDKLRSNITNKRLGIILPPGKLATIANLACILAGITPVNINYDITAPTFRYQAEQSGINRFITEARFIHKQQQFPWPSQRDLIYIDRELTEISNTSLRLRELAIRFDKAELYTRHLHRHAPRPADEAMLFFSSATGGTTKGVPMSHTAILTAIMQMSSRLEVSRGQRVLSALPLSQPMGMLCGMLMPLLQGMDMVTYPDTRAPRRLCELAHNYSTVLTAFTPAQTAELLDAGKPEHFATLRYFLVTGEKLPTGLAHRAINEYKLMLQECYSLTEAAAPVAICAPPPAPAPGTPHIIPAGYAGCVGAPLPGIAVRISDLNRPEKTLPSTATGLIWLKGNTVLSRYLKDKPESTTCMRGNWFCTGDVGKLDADGLLTICGRKSRFSKIGDDLVPHIAAEEALARVLGAPEGDGNRRLAIVGAPNPRGGGEILVLLSTLHKTVVPQDLITARYALLNARYPASWAPDRIIPVNAIPQLPNGKLDYPVCFRGVCSYLGIDPSQIPLN